MSVASSAKVVVKNIDLSGAEGAALCAAIHKDAFDPLDEAGWSAQAMEELMSSAGVHVLLAYFEGEGAGDVPAGFALYRLVAGEAELITLATMPDFQGRGVARALLHEMRCGLEAAGAEKLFLEVRADNLRAVKLYSDLGFEKIGKRSNYYKTRSGNHVDALCLGLFLRAACDHKEN